MANCKFSKIHCLYLSFFILGVLLIILAVVLPFVIESAIQKEAKEQIIMRNNNFNLWGIIPGQSEVNMRRMYYFYNFTNPKEFLYQNERPVFVEVGPYIYDEFQNYTNVNFTKNPKDGFEEIHYKFWQYFLESKDNKRNLSDNILSLNLGSLGVWYQAKNVPKHKMALQIFSNLVLGLESEIMKVILAQGIQTFIKNKNDFYSIVLQSTRVPKDSYEPLWNDELFGWKNWTSLRTWVQASLDGLQSEASKILMEHFHLSHSNMYAILNGPLEQWIETTKTLAMNWYCQNQSYCNTLYLAVCI